MAEYEGHKSKGHWNVALWLGNDEGLYNLCMDALRECKTLARATARVLRWLDGDKTPDGYKYTRDRIYQALAGLRE